MLYIVIFGPPGSGKGTQSEKIIEKYGLTHIATGDILRNEIKNGTNLGNTAKEFIDKGQLVPDETIIRMIENKIAEIKNQTKGVIFDGFPRTVDQAIALKDMLADRNEKIKLMLYLEVPRDELIRRLSKRAETSGRTDDTPETIENRLKVYEDITSPVMEFYKQEGTFRCVSKIGAIDEIFIDIEKIIDNL
ncbi:MAG: adenylate kinase [Marinilabiliaceae bacterium]|nr:adenylate kinase [Marinilabiliaceae bacterium]